jgi:hypothetical protein
VLLWLGLITAATLALAYAAERPLYYAHEEASHTHAFDDWASPFPADASVGWQPVREKLLQKVEVLEPVALGGLALLVVLGLLLRRFDRREGLEAWWNAPPATGRVPRWDLILPGPVLGLAVLAGLIVFSVVALYIYYPTPEEAFEEIVRVRADALSAVQSARPDVPSHKDEAIRKIQQWDLLTRKLQVGVFIRTGRIDPTATQVTEDLRERLEDLRDALLAGKLDRAKAMIWTVQEAYQKCRRAYLSAAAAVTARASQ